MERISSSLLRAITGLTLPLVPLMAMAAAARFDIDRQPLSAALKAFADQSHMQLLYQHDTVAGFTANAVTGELDTHAALESLLRHSGLEVIYSSDTAATIRQPQNRVAGDPEPAKSANAVAEPIAPLPQVTIEGAPDIDKQVREFVSEATRQVAASAASPPSLARWNQPICPRVDGLSAASSDSVLLHLSQAAAAVGIKIEPSPCQVSLYIVASNEPERLARSLHKRVPGLFGAAAPAVVERFFNTQRPVRVWYNTQFVGKYGNKLGPADVSKTPRQPLRNSLAELSRLEFDDVRLIFTVVEVVDVARIAGIGTGRLADYLAMAGLAEINFDADLHAAPTILRTFDALGDPVAASDVPSELTTWDRGFLHGLYVTAQSSKMQRSLIEDVMLRDLAQN